MSLESKVCTLGQAKRLEGLGVSEDSIFFWVKEPDEKWGIFYHENIPYAEEPSIHAYTSAELGEMITKTIFDKFGHRFYWGQTITDDGVIRIRFISRDDLLSYGEVKQETNEAHARAEFLIYLLENRE